MNAVHVVVPDAIDDPSRPSGGNTYDRHVCRELAALGWSVHEHRAPGFWAAPGAASFAALDRVIQHIPDGALVLLDGLVASTAPAVLVPQAGRLGIVVLVHLPLGLRAQDAEVRRREHAVLSSATAIVTTSAWSARQLIALYDLPAHRVHVAVPGAAAVDPAPGSASGRALLSVAAVTFDKGQDLLLDALRSVSELAWHCACVGSLDRDPAFVEHLRRQLAIGGLAGRLSLPGPRTGPDLQRDYAAADVLVSASRVETYGIVITEALARGLPVIATDVGGVPEAIGYGDDDVRPALLVPPEDPQALGAAVRAWLVNADLRTRLRRAARERRESLPPWSATAETIADVLSTTTHEPRQSELASPPRAG